MPDQVIADRQYTIEQYLARSGRDALPLDRQFVQGRTDRNHPAPGPLAAFVHRGRDLALEQYLLLHAFASGEDDGRYDMRLLASTWARAIGGYFDPQTGRVEPAALHLVSRNWRLLEELKLIERTRVRRRARVSLLADDGSGAPYRRPGAGRRGRRLVDGERGYLQLPYAYWRSSWHERLGLPAKAMLLIALTLGDGFRLPYAQMPGWYGISPSTAERGLNELRKNGLLHREQHRHPDTESPVGFSDAYYYELLPPFGPRKTPSKSIHPAWIGPLGRNLAEAPMPARTKRRRIVKRRSSISSARARSRVAS